MKNNSEGLLVMQFHGCLLLVIILWSVEIQTESNRILICSHRRTEVGRYDNKGITAFLHFMSEPADGTIVLKKICLFISPSDCNMQEVQTGLAHKLYGKYCILHSYLYMM